MENDNRFDNLTLEMFRKDFSLYLDFISFFFKFKPYPYQERFLKLCLHNNRVAGIWSRQSGKSQTVAIYVLSMAIIEKLDIMIVAPTLTHASELYSKIRNITTQNPFLSSLLVTSSQTEMAWENGSRIKALPTGPEGRAIRGFTADIIVNEEAGMMSDDVMNSAVTPLIASKGADGQLIKIGTPWIKNHFYNSCYVDALYKVVEVSWEEPLACGQYTQEFIDEQKANLTDVQFQTEYCAKFVEENLMFFPSSLLNNCMEEYFLISA